LKIGPGGFSRGQQHWSFSLPATALHIVTFFIALYNEKDANKNR